MLRRYPLLNEVDQSLGTLIPNEPVELAGTWLESTRRTYETTRQTGTGSGPFRDVIDTRWSGSLTSAEPIAGIAFLATAVELFWVKSVPATPTLPVEVSLHAYAEHSDHRATFTAGMGGAVLPGVPVACEADMASACTVGPARLATGRVERLAQADDAALFVLLIRGRFLEVGRHRLWRLRDSVASSLPSSVRELLTRGRTGSIRRETPAA